MPPITAPAPLASPSFLIVFTLVTVPQSLHSKRAWLGSATRLADAKSAPEMSFVIVVFMGDLRLERKRNCKQKWGQTPFSAEAFSCGKRITSRIDGLSVK